MPTTINRLAKTASGIAVAGMLAVFATPVEAMTAAQKRAACTPDVFRLCSAQIPQVSQIIACLKKKRASLSPGCRKAFNHRG